MGSPNTNQESAVGPPPPASNTSSRMWPEPGALTMEFISRNCTSLFHGFGFLGPPVDFDLDPSIKPIHGPIHRQPISKLETIKAALDTYEATGQLIRVSQPTDWISNMVVREREPTPTKLGKDRICLDPSQTLNKVIRCPIAKYIIPTLVENLHKLYDGDRCKGSLPKHPSNVKVVPDDHNAHTLGPLQMDPPAI